MSEEIQAPAAAPNAEPKPPPIMVGVQGFDGMKRPADAVDWIALCRNPVFQMFIEEREPNGLQIQSDRYAAERAQAAIGAIGADAFQAEYEAWHAAKGCWPHETPYGRPR